MPGESRVVRFSAPDVSAAKGRISVVQGATGELAAPALPNWAFGPFVRPDGVNPVIAPKKESVFDCPMQ